MNLLGIVTKLDFRFSHFSILLNFIFLFFKKDISQEVSDFDFVVINFDPNKHVRLVLIVLRSEQLFAAK